VNGGAHTFDPIRIGSAHIKPELKNCRDNLVWHGPRKDADQRVLVTARAQRAVQCDGQFLLARFAPKSVLGRIDCPRDRVLWSTDVGLNLLPQPLACTQLSPVQAHFNAGRFERLHDKVHIAVRVVSPCVGKPEPTRTRTQRHIAHVSVLPSRACSQLAVFPREARALSCWFQGPSGQPAAPGAVAAPTSHRTASPSSSPRRRTEKPLMQVMTRTSREQTSQAQASSGDADARGGSPRRRSRAYHLRPARHCATISLVTSSG